MAKLQGSREGLTSEEAASRQQRFGPNKLPEQAKAGWLRIFIRQFKNPLIYILLVAGTVSVVIGEFTDGIFIFAVLLLNAVIRTLQERKAESSAQALQQVIEVTVKVKRDHKPQRLNVVELVPGDFVLLGSGDAVPADIRLVSAENLRTDESLLTGESIPVEKNAEDELDEGTPLLAVSATSRQIYPWPLPWPCRLLPTAWRIAMSLSDCCRLWKGWVLARSSLAIKPAPSRPTS